MIVKEKLYKKDRNGNVLMFFVEVINETTYHAVVSTSGRYDGTLTSSSTLIREGKNIGKANETTPEQQAISEAESKWNKKKDEGYKSINDLLTEDNKPVNLDSSQLLDWLKTNLPDQSTDASGNVKPMLAQVFKEKKHKRETVYLQPKLNGVRCLMIPTSNGYKAISRKGKSYDICTVHIRNILADYLDEFTNYPILDGELYIHETPLQYISGLVRKKDRVPEHDELQYHIYDIVENSPFRERHRNLFQYLIKCAMSSNTIHLVNTDFKSFSKIQEFEKACIDSGYEGVIIRHSDGFYEAGQRSHSLLKLKRFQEDEFEIIGYKVDKGKTVGDSFVFELKTKKGNEFFARPVGTRADKISYYENIDDYIGKMATVKYFENTVDGKPHHGHVITIRDYE